MTFFDFLEGVTQKAAKDLLGPVLDFSKILWMDKLMHHFEAIFETTVDTFVFSGESIGRRPKATWYQQSRATARGALAQLGLLDGSIGWLGGYLESP